MIIKNFTEFKKINELNHQSIPTGINSPGYGQGAHVGNWGVNYGNPSKGVRGTFGEKGDKLDPHFPKTNKKDDYPTVVYDQENNSYLTKDDTDDLKREYEIKCKQNSELPEEFSNIDSKAVEFMKNYINENI